MTDRPTETPETPETAPASSGSEGGAGSDAQSSERRTRLVIYAVATALLLAAAGVWALWGGGDTDSSTDGEDETSATVTAEASGTIPAHDGSAEGDGSEAGGDADTGAAAGDGTTGDSGDTGSNGSAPDAGDGDPPPADGASGDLAQNALAHLEIEDFSTPQTYEAAVTVLGWQDPQAGAVYVDVGSARLMGPIDALTGEEMGPPPADDIDQSARFEGLAILSTTSQGVRGSLPTGASETVRLLLLPSGEGAIFLIDRLS